MTSNEIDENDSKNIDKAELMKLIGNGGTDKEVIFKYLAYEANAVLYVGQTQDSIYFLLRNGLILTWDENEKKNRRILIRKDKLISHLKFPVKVIDLRCGREHCLAMGTTMKIYSWGVNSYGQLGLAGLPINQSSIRNEPTEIESIRDQISQIFAFNKNSYAISQGGKLYGWGSNEYGQLKKDKKGESRNFQIPTELNLKDYNIQQAFTIFVNQKNERLYLAELRRQIRNMADTVEMNFDRVQNSREFELIGELEKLQTEKLSYRMTLATHEDFLIFKNNTNEMILRFEDKINGLELKSKTLSDTHSNKDSISFFDSQIKFLTEKQSTMVDSIKKLNSKSEIQGKNNEIEVKSSEDAKDLTETYTGTDSNYSNKIIVSKLISRVNTELQFQKHIVLNNHLKYEEAIKKKDSNLKKLRDYIKIFQKIIDITEENIHSKFLLTNSIAPKLNLFKQLQREILTFEWNRFKNITHLSAQGMNTRYILQNTISNNKDLKDKMETMNNIGQSDEFIKKVSDIFLRNIKLSQENNHLMDNIFKLSTRYYNKTFEKLISFTNPSYFNEVKNKIEIFKNQSKKDETAIDDSIDDSLEEIHSDDSFNY